MGDKLFIEWYDYGAWLKNTEKLADKKGSIDKAELTDVRIDQCHH